MYLITHSVFITNRLNIHVTNHEEHVLMRRFDHNNDGKISMEEFYNTIAKELMWIDKKEREESFGKQASRGASAEKAKAA